MLKVTNTEVFGWEAAIRGMRNPLESWDKSDSGWHGTYVYATGMPIVDIGPNDLALMKKLVAAGSDHSKFMRMIHVQCDWEAPLYWWKEADTYKVGTVANSCSTMHKVADKEFSADDFSHEHLTKYSMENLDYTIAQLNFWRGIYLNGGQVTNFDGTDRIFEPKDKDAWWQLIQLLPSSYNQRRTFMVNYEVLANIYKSRRGHKLDEWRRFCDWIETLPYSELITGKEVAA